MLVRADELVERAVRVPNLVRAAALLENLDERHIGLLVVDLNRHCERAHVDQLEKLVLLDRDVDERSDRRGSREQHDRHRRRVVGQLDKHTRQQELSFAALE